MEERILEEVDPKEIYSDVDGGYEEQGPNLFLYHNDNRSVTIFSGEKWYVRVWLWLSNPFRYLFTGKVRY
jgi:hypothetical protein